MSREYIDVTKEYINSKHKSKGNIFYEDNYNASIHLDEIEMAIWIHNNFGGDIKLVTENNCSYGVKSCDYVWNNKLWELKTLKSEKSIDSALRKAIEQIYPNPGGIILNFNKCNIIFSQIKNRIQSRIEASCRFKLDIIIVCTGKLERVIRYN